MGVAAVPGSTMAKCHLCHTLTVISQQHASTGISNQDVLNQHHNEMTAIEVRVWGRTASVELDHQADAVVLVGLDHHGFAARLECVLISAALVALHV